MIAQHTGTTIMPGEVCDKIISCIYMTLLQECSVHIMGSDCLAVKVAFSKARQKILNASTTRLSCSKVDREENCENTI